MSDLKRPSWHFREVPDGTRENEQTQEEFFSNADVVSEVSALIRESVQNSLDECVDPTKKIPVKMVFAIRNQTPAITDKYFSELYPHVRKSISTELPEFSTSSKYLTIEDFNTKGLEGSTSSKAPKEDGLEKDERSQNESFWYFEWKTGGSNKKSGARGSWGVGKIVFPRASGIKTYLVYSCRNELAAPEKNPNILFGHCILKYRTMHYKRYVPDCQWMILPNENAPIPTSDEGIHAEFISDWSLTRKPGNLGTSIVIPFCKESLTAQKLVQSIIRDYFVTILSGLLECEVIDEAGKKVLITRENLVDQIEQIDDELSTADSKGKTELKLICAMYVSKLNYTTNRFTILGSQESPNDWAAIKIPEDQEIKMSEILAKGETLEVEVQTTVPRTSDFLSESKDYFTVLMKQMDNFNSATVFCREGILIPAANSKSVLQNMISMVIVGNLVDAGKLENSLANLMKNSEGPSHETWSPNASKFKNRYKPEVLGKKTISWVKNSVERIVRILQKQDDTKDDRSLSKFFPIPDDGNTLTEAEGESPTGLPAAPQSQVHLTGQVKDHKTGEIELKWVVTNFSQSKYRLLQILPSRNDVESGTENFKWSGVIDKPNVKHIYQVLISDGNIEIASNKVSLFMSPIPPKMGVHINRIPNGFSINSDSLAPLVKGQKIEISIAYASRGGNSIGSWAAEDFDLNKRLASRSVRGLKVERAENNSVILIVQKTEFSAEWNGFDTLRDLIVEPKLKGKP
jgi:hypothetical protein